MISYQDDRVSSLAYVQSRLAIRIDVVLGDEALGRESQKNARCSATAHLVVQHHHLAEKGGGVL